ncbi:MAG TPA: hypothetical protein VH079_02110 [Terriglobales bacterium]|nr:hypothetical protein [Terriglobales bacterium]
MNDKKKAREISVKVTIFILLLACFGTDVSAQQKAIRISLSDAVILVDNSEASYVQFGARDLGSYLTGITGQTVTVTPTSGATRKAKTVIAIGEKAATAMGTSLPSTAELGDEGSVIRAFDKAGTTVVVIAGLNPHGTNEGIATFMQMVQAEGKSPYIDGPLDLLSKPSIAVRGIHLNGWPLKYPYAFRSWKEEDWKHFIDIAWAQHINLFYLWPFMEIIPIPLSAEDQAYLQEVQRVIDYAQKQRGMEVWIMQSANRIGVGDCGIRDPRFRTYWVMGECQQDMNPADPEQFSKIEKSFEALYKTVNNADGFCFIDSDPGGWPRSPLSDQTKIFNAARKLLDRYSAKGAQTKLINWMWQGWGREYDPTETNRRQHLVDFMDETIRNFKENLKEPWELISGSANFLEASKKESVLNKTIYLQYGAIEMEPAFPLTNLGQESIREVFDKAAMYPELRGVMGNNELMSLQFPRTFYFFKTAWDLKYENHPEPQVLRELAAQLYPDHKELIADSFMGLRGNDPEKIKATLGQLEKLVKDGSAGRPGAIGRLLFPDRLVVARNLKLQLEIRLARQSLLKGLSVNPSVDESAKLVEDYFDKLLAWNQETGWDKMIDINIWRTAIYEDGKDFTEAAVQLKKILAQGKPYTSYSQTDEFLAGISKHLLQKYGRDSVMIGCIEPLKMALIQN